MDIPAEVIAAFPPSRDLLLELARRHTDDAMLTDIARANYGWMAAEIMLDLRPIRDTGVIPIPLSWNLSEVLTLTQFSDPDKPEIPPFEPGPTGRRGHQTRLFACAVILRVEAELIPESRIDSDSTLARCLDSASVLGEEMSEAIACFLTWQIARLETAYESLLFALGLLILATRLRSGRIDEPLLGTMAGWVLDLESPGIGEFPFANPANPMPLEFSIQQGFWQPLAAELRDATEAIRDDTIRTNIQLCGLLIDPGWDG